MKSKLALIIPALLGTTYACAGSFQPSISTDCSETGSIGSDRVPHPTQGYDISFQYYLPPCYEDESSGRYPVIYLISMPYEQKLNGEANTPMSLSDRLIRARRMPPTILILPNDVIGYGYHAALVEDLVPYVGEKFLIFQDRRYRAVGGISHGAAIAARMAFQFPQIFGSLGIFSGGIDTSEKLIFQNWIASSSPEDRPRILVSAGDQDGILPLTQNLREVLDSQNVPYELDIEAGGHDWIFWSAHMEPYLLWFAEAWE